jgi:hypothetical protein
MKRVTRTFRVPLAKTSLAMPFVLMLTVDVTEFQILQLRRHRREMLLQ